MRAPPLSIGTIHFVGIARRGAAKSTRRGAAKPMRRGAAQVESR